MKSCRDAPQKPYCEGFYCEGINYLVAQTARFLGDVCQSVRIRKTLREANFIWSRFPTKEGYPNLSREEASGG